MLPAAGRGRGDEDTGAQMPTSRSSRAARVPRSAIPTSLATNVWVNGVWIRSISTDTLCQIGRRGMLGGTVARLDAGALRDSTRAHRANHLRRRIQHDSGKASSDSAIYIVLKQGVAYQPGAKSYVVDESAEPGKKTAAARQAGATSTSSDSAASPRDSRRRCRRTDTATRVFDEDTGEPIAGAHVRRRNRATT